MWEVFGAKTKLKETAFKEKVTRFGIWYLLLRKVELKAESEVD